MCKSIGTLGLRSLPASGFMRLLFPNHQQRVTLSPLFPKHLQWKKAQGSLVICYQSCPALQHKSDFKLCPALSHSIFRSHLTLFAHLFPGQESFPCVKRLTWPLTAVALENTMEKVKMAWNVCYPGLRWMKSPLIQITSAGVWFGGGKWLDQK